MADQIQNNEFAYLVTPGWHGKGQQINAANLAACTTKEERTALLLASANLNFKIERRRLAMRGFTPDGKLDLQNMLTDPLADYRAIVRSDNDVVWQVAKKGYHPHQPSEIVGFFDEYCAAGHATLQTLGAIDGGRIIFALAKLHTPLADSVIGPVSEAVSGCDLSLGYMLLFTSNDGSLATCAKATNVYVVCANTLAAARAGKGQQFKMKHTRVFTAAAAQHAREVMGMGLEQIQQNNETANRLSRVRIDAQGREQFVRELLDLQVKADGSAPIVSLETIGVAGKASERQQEAELGRLGKSILDAMLNSPGSDLASRKDTLWGCVNGVTWVVDHEKGRTDDTRLTSAWFGVGDTLKSEAVTIANRIAGI